MTLLFDASSVYAALVSRRIEPLFNQSTVALARYEVLNVIWKHSYLRKTIDGRTADVLVNSLVNVLSEMDVHSINQVEAEVMELAVKTGLSIYDSVYLYTAKFKELTIVTEDKRLEKAATREQIPVKKLEDL